MTTVTVDRELLEHVIETLTPIDRNTTDDARGAAHTVITALCEVLEQPAQPKKYPTCKGMECQAEHAAIAGEQEQPRPYAWVPPERDGTFHYDHSSITAYRSEMAGWRPVYLHPAKPWVELKAEAELAALRDTLAKPAPVAIVEIVVPHLHSIVVKHIPKAAFPKVGDWLYTHPAAPRPWVGLTEADWDEIDEAVGLFDQGAIWAAGKLREKNT